MQAPHRSSSNIQISRLLLGHHPTWLTAREEQSATVVRASTLPFAAHQPISSPHLLPFANRSLDLKNSEQPQEAIT